MCMWVCGGRARAQLQQLLRQQQHMPSAAVGRQHHTPISNSSSIVTHMHNTICTSTSMVSIVHNVPVYCRDLLLMNDAC